MQPIIPHLWFDKEAKKAAEFYSGLFEDSGITRVTTLHETPAGDAEIVRFRLAGQSFMAISAGPDFRFNPSVSLMVACHSAEEVDAKWQALSEGGTPLMELGEYPFSKRYGWIQDRYGLSWQLMYMEGVEIRQRITPNLLFSADACGKAEEAIRFYTEVFPDSTTDFISRYGPGEAQSQKAVINYAAFTLAGSPFSAMDNGFDVDFGFNEAISFIVRCDDQQEIDRYWDALSAVPEAEQCGWLKDRFGLSWQIVPTAMDAMLSEGTEEEIRRITEAFLKMKKFDIAALEQARQGSIPAKTSITVETVVNKPIEAVWSYWTETPHIMAWNNASDDWYTPSAENDLRAGGSFTYRMAARDGSFAFDFSGTYDEVTDRSRITYTIGDGRKVAIRFTAGEEGIHISETFEAETANSVELQRNGWQAILDNFKRYAESR